MFFSLLQMTAPIGIRVLARLCLHKFIATKVKAFKEKYPIGEDQVLKILRSKKSKLKKLRPCKVDEDLSDFEMKEEEKISRKTSEKRVHDSGNESDESKNFNRSHSESEDEEENINFEEEDSDDVSEEDNDSENKFNISNKSDIDSEDEESDNVREDTITNIKLEDKTKVSNKTNVKHNLKKEDYRLSVGKSLETKLIKNNIILGDSIMNITKQKEGENDTEAFTDEESINSEDKVKVKNKMEKVRAVDPFFITIENKEYVTNQVPSVSENEISKYGPEHSEWKFDSDFESKKFTRLHSYTKLPSERWGSNNNNNKASLADVKHMQKYGFFSQANGLGDGFKNRRERRLNLHKNVDEPKQIEKFKPQFHIERREERRPNTNFDIPIQIEKYKPQFYNERREERRPNKDVQHVVAKPKVEKLHPSWEAKKKLTSIAPFQGKKITFDD